MIEGVSLSWLKKQCPTGEIRRIVCTPKMGWELAFFPQVEEVVVCTPYLHEAAWMELLWVGMRTLKKTGMETLLGLNKAGRRVFLYHQIRDALGCEARQFWDAHEDRIRKGLLIDEFMEKWLSRLHYGKNGLRWRWLGKNLFSQPTGQRVFSKQEWLRIQKRRGGGYLFPWRDETLLLEIAEHASKSILPHTSRFIWKKETIIDWFTNQEDQSVDVAFLWDAIEERHTSMSEICRVVKKTGNVLLAANHLDSWIEKYPEQIISHTEEAHFRYARVYWLKID